MRVNGSTQRFENFLRVFNLLEKYGSKKPENELERAGVIQFFEMSFELSWKVMKDYLEVEGLIVKSPREKIKTAIQIELIIDGHGWMDALGMRNSTVHLYDEKAAKEAVNQISKFYIPIMKNLKTRLEQELEKCSD